MAKISVKKTRLLFSSLIFLLLVLATVGVIYFARGYRPTLRGGTIQGTGLLSATSYPPSAQVFVDGKLTTATDDTINLLPGEYTVRITKEGFLPWEKRLLIEAELVTATTARLFPSVPSLSALTFSGAGSPLTSPDGRRIAFLTTHADRTADNGLYILDLNSSLLSFSKNPSQVASIPDATDLNSAVFTFSPDSRQVLLAFTDTTGNAISRSYLLDSDRLTNLSSAPDATIRLPLIFSQWEELLAQTHQENLRLLPTFIADLASSSAITNIFFSPDNEKMLYTATQEITIPGELRPPLDSTNFTPQDRDLKPFRTYVYDIKEDTNYLISEVADSERLPLFGLLTPPLPTTDSTSTPAATGLRPLFTQLQQDKTALQTLNLFRLYSSPLLSGNPLWYHTSRHLITTKDNKITVFEYDNLNHAVVYSGPFDSSFTAASLNGNRLLLLTNLNQSDAPNNLYSLDLK